MSDSPAVLLYDGNSKPLAIKDGVAIPTDHPGVVVLGSDGANVKFLRMASDGTVRTDPTGTTTQPVSASALPLPAGAATEATLATLSTEAKLEAVRALLATIDADTSTLAAVDYATQTTLAALLVKNTEIDAVLDTIFTRQNDRNQKTQITNGTLDVSVTADATVNRMEISGKVQTVGAIPPPSTTPVQINADTPLTVGSHDTTFTIPDGETFHLQQITAGNEDPTKGASVEVIFNNGAEHLIERVYTSGSSIQIGYTDITTARDGTALLGNGAGTSDIIVRRLKYSGSDIAIDAEVVGYSA